MHILSTNPASEEYGPKWEDLRDIFRNAHEVVNLYRPWQSREALIGIMEDMVRKGKEEVESVAKLKEKVENVLGELAGDLNVEQIGETRRDQRGDSDGKYMEEERRLWQLITDEVNGGSNPHTNGVH